MASAGGGTDMDGDSQMHSSASSDSEAMFPEDTGPATPQNVGLISNLRDTGLSPPGSQEPGSWQPVSYDAMDMGEGVAGAADMTREGGKDGTKGCENEPGWEWNNPKAREEHDRAMEQVLDSDFNLREFGELLDAKEIAKITGTKV